MRKSRFPHSQIRSFRLSIMTNSWIIRCVCVKKMHNHTIYCANCYVADLNGIWAALLLIKRRRTDKKIRMFLVYVTWRTKTSTTQKKNEKRCPYKPSSPFLQNISYFNSVLNAPHAADQLAVKVFGNPAQIHSFSRFRCWFLI